MKKFTIMCLTICILLMSGCVNSNSAQHIIEQPDDTNQLKPSLQADIENQKNSDNNKSKDSQHTIEQSDTSQIKPSLQADIENGKISDDNKSETKKAQEVTDSFFFGKDISEVKYSLKDRTNRDITLHINEIDFKLDKMYELKLDEIDDIPDDRLTLGYFYVQEDKIYKIDTYYFDKQKTIAELLLDSAVVCQENELEDDLDEDEKGWHQYIKIDGSIREYHAWNNLVETGYYEAFTWEKGKGLVYYRSGFGAERDGIELTLINNK